MENDFLIGDFLKLFEKVVIMNFNNMQSVPIRPEWKSWPYYV